MAARYPIDNIADGSQKSPLATALGTLLSLILLLIAVPLAGALTRYRAQYSPRRVALGTNGEHSAPASSAKGGSSYFEIIARTYRKEGLSGLYRGLVPTVLQLVFLTVFSVVVVVSRQHNAAYPIPTETIPSDFLYSLILTLAVIPLTILTYRSMATPVPLSILSPRRSACTIFSSCERSRPWTLYAIPGLVAAQVLYVIFCPLVMRLFRQIFVPDLVIAPDAGTSLAGDDATGAWWGPAVYIAFVVFVSVVLTPLEIISVRLAVQEDTLKNDTTLEVTECSPLVGNTSEPVVELRSNVQPYTGLVDCARKILDEEGRGTLYRAWWITFLVTLGIAFA